MCTNRTFPAWNTSRLLQNEARREITDFPFNIEKTKSGNKPFPMTNNKRRNGKRFLFFYFQNENFSFKKKNKSEKDVKFRFSIFIYSLYIIYYIYL